MATGFNISGELTQQLLMAGDGFNVTFISFVNIHATATCTVDLYIEKKLTGKFYILKALTLPVGVTLVLEGDDINFDNKLNEFGLYIKLTGSSASAVDVIIS